MSGVWFPLREQESVVAFNCVLGFEPNTGLCGYSAAAKFLSEKRGVKVSAEELFEMSTGRRVQYPIPEDLWADSIFFFAN